jgi:hexosaminidase
MDVFPFEYVHIGGDEAVKADWKRAGNARRCGASRGEGRARAAGIFSQPRDRPYRVPGRRAVVWNDGLCRTLDDSAVVQYWTPLSREGAAQIARYVNAGGAAILSPVTRLYFDYPYAATPLAKTYRYRPSLHGIRRGNESRILGVEAALWTEWVDTEEKLFFNILPRLAATAETGWTARGGKRYSIFLSG